MYQHSSLPPGRPRSRACASLGWTWMDNFSLVKIYLTSNGGCRPAGPSNQISPICRSEEHTSELQSLMRTSYAVFCLKKKKRIKFVITQTKQYNSTYAQIYSITNQYNYKTSDQTLTSN